MDVLVVGAGDVGRWFASLADAPVSFTDVDAERAEAAAAAYDGRANAVPLDTEESFGLVVVAVPMRVAVDAIEQHAGRAERAVVDFTGEMAAPLAAMAKTAPARERVSFHPLFAPEHAPGRIAVSESAPGPATDHVREWLEGAGNTLVDVAPAEHDDAMETIQGRAHAAVLAFALAADDVPEELSTPVYRDLADVAERVTGGNARVYADIQAAFDGSVAVAEAATRLADADRDEFEDAYEDASEDADQ